MQRGLYNQGLSIFPSSTQLSVSIQTSLIAVKLTAMLLVCQVSLMALQLKWNSSNIKTNPLFPAFHTRLIAPGQGNLKTTVIKPVFFFFLSVTMISHQEIQAFIHSQKKLQTIRCIFSPMNIN